MEFRAAFLDYMNSVSIAAVELDHSTGRIGWFAKPVEFVMEKHDPGKPINKGTMEFDKQAAVSLMNALWHAGIRPTDFKSPNGEINRLEKHLADMQRLVFKNK